MPTEEIRENILKIYDSPEEWSKDSKRIERETGDSENW